MKQRKGITNGETITSNADHYDNTSGERVPKIYQRLAILLQLFIHFPSFPGKKRENVQELRNDQGPPAFAITDLP